MSAAFLGSSPEIPGLHESIMIKPGSLHLTLGVLSLASLPSQASSASRQHSVDDALRLLRTLETPIRSMLTDSGSLEVPLDYMDVMRSRQNQRSDESHVMWAGPDVHSDTGKLLKTVCGRLTYHSVIPERLLMLNRFGELYLQECRDASG